MRNYLSEIENILYGFMSTSVARRFSRTTTSDSIILCLRSRCDLSVYLTRNYISISYAGEYEEFDITDISDVSNVLELVGSFINELATGALIYERIYHGHVQTKCRVTLVNRISHRTISLRDTVLTSRYTQNEPKLILREKIFFD